MKIRSILLREAYELGVEAHESGMKCIPCQDSKMMELVRENQSGHKFGFSASLFEQWSVGWKSNSRKPSAVCA